MQTLKGHVTSVTSLAFSPSALLLVSGCCKGWMNIWALQVLAVVDSFLFCYLLSRDHLRVSSETPLTL